MVVVALVFISMAGLSAQAACAVQETEKIAVRAVELDGGYVFEVSNVANVDVVEVHAWLSQANVNVDPPMLGSTSRDGDFVWFKPRFPLRAGTKFNVSVSADPKLKPLFFTVETPSKDQDRAKITAVYPSSDVVPENTLKFYVEFSTPMRKGDVYDFIQLREVDGAEIELPFLEIEQELWSRDSKRLTLLLDPGRIKRGLKPREEMGPIFESGKSYELVIDGAWPNADGLTLGETHVKQFRATDEDKTQPDPEHWKVTTPAVGSVEPLVVRFQEPLDHSMLQRALQVYDEKGKRIAGTVLVTDEEQQWRFVPETDWQTGDYRVSVDINLEDNAGNSIGRQFDVDVFEQTEQTSTATLELKFQL